MRLPLRLLVVTTTLAPFTAFAEPGFVSRVPNGASQSCLTCHQVASPNSGNRERNPFGQAFDAAGQTWTASLCGADADNDGQTNGQELGDPACTWAMGADPARTTSLSLPGDPASTSDDPDGVDDVDAPAANGGADGGDDVDDAGGCTSTNTGGAPLAAFVLAAALLRRRRR